MLESSSNPVTTEEVNQFNEPPYKVLIGGAWDESDPYLRGMTYMYPYDISVIDLSSIHAIPEVDMSQIDWDFYWQWLQ